MGAGSTGGLDLVHKLGNVFPDNVFNEREPINGRRNP
jgi:hypothetical protein